MKTNKTPRFLQQCNSFLQQTNKEIQELIMSEKLKKVKTNHQRNMIRINQQKKHQQRQVKQYENLVKSVIIDFFRYKNYNYTYTVFMREANIISQQITLKNSLVETLMLQKQVEKYDCKSIVELLISKFICQKKIITQTGIQTLNQQNSLVANEANRIFVQNRIRQVRLETQKIQREYYAKMLQSNRATDILQMKEKLSQQYDEKLKKMKKEFYQIEKPIKEGISQNVKKQGQINNERILQEIGKLQLENNNLLMKVKELEKYRLSHRCFETEEWKERQKERNVQKKQLEKIKRQYELALKTMGTKVQDMIQQKETIMKKTNPTDIYLKQKEEVKKVKNYMVDQLNDQLNKMERRLQILANDNDQLRQQNTQLKHKIKKISVNNPIDSVLTQINTVNISPDTLSLTQNTKEGKNVLVGVSQREIDIESQIKRKANEQSQEESSDEITKKYESQRKVAQLFEEMRRIKNKARLTFELN